MNAIISKSRVAELYSTYISSIPDFLKAILLTTVIEGGSTPQGSPGSPAQPDGVLPTALGGDGLGGGGDGDGGEGEGGDGEGGGGEGGGGETAAAAPQSPAQHVTNSANIILSHFEAPAIWR